MSKITDSNQAFLTKLQVLYHIEMELERALPKMEKASKGPALKEGFSSHLRETKNHIIRLEKIFGMLGVKPKKLTSDGIKGIVKDGSWVMKVNASENIKDSMIAGSARYAEHFEMAGYKTAILQANSLGLSDIVMLLSETLSEEEVADQKLEEVIQNNFA